MSGYEWFTRLGVGVTAGQRPPTRTFRQVEASADGNLPGTERVEGAPKPTSRLVRQFGRGEASKLPDVGSWSPGDYGPQKGYVYTQAWQWGGGTKVVHDGHLEDQPTSVLSASTSSPLHSIRGDLEVR